MSDREQVEMTPDERLLAGVRILLDAAARVAAEDAAAARDERPIAA